MKDLVQAVQHSSEVVAAQQAHKKAAARAASAGSLRSQMKSERMSRLASVQNSVDQRMSRFGGLIVQKSATTPISQSGAGDAKEGSSIVHLKRGLTGHTSSSNKGTVGSQINNTALGGQSKKRGKKCTFADSSKAGSSLQSLTDAGGGSSSCSVHILQASMRSSAGGLGDEERSVNLALAEFLNAFMTHAFNELVFATKKGWRRADANTARHDLLFYSLATSCLEYARHFHLEDLRAHTAAKERGEGDSSPWVPELKNVTECFDRMFISHSSDTVKRHFEAGKAARGGSGDVIVPLKLYKEIISFLRIMLESEDTAHHDIAMTALFRIFFNPTTTDCLDILPVLLRSWTPQGFSKAHMLALVELSHETLKLLDLADLHARAMLQQTTEKMSRKEIKALTGREQNVAAALSFSREQYLQRLASCGAVGMYTKALEFYRENSPQLNHYIYTFLKRIKEHVLENDDDWDQQKREGRQLTLGCLLFNIGTLNIFNVILSDVGFNKNIEVCSTPLCVFMPLIVLFSVFAAIGTSDQVCGAEVW